MIAVCAQKMLTRSTVERRHCFQVMLVNQQLVYLDAIRISYFLLNVVDIHLINVGIRLCLASPCFCTCASEGVPRSQRFQATAQDAPTSIHHALRQATSPSSRQNKSVHPSLHLFLPRVPPLRRAWFRPQAKQRHADEKRFAVVVIVICIFLKRVQMITSILLSGNYIIRGPVSIRSRSSQTAGLGCHDDQSQRCVFFPNISFGCCCR